MGVEDHVLGTPPRRHRYRTRLPRRLYVFFILPPLSLPLLPRIRVGVGDLGARMGVSFPAGVPSNGWLVWVAQPLWERVAPLHQLGWFAV